MEKVVKSQASRRSWLSASLAAAGVATLVKIQPSNHPLQETQAPSEPVPERGGGYRMSEHVKKYIFSTRL